MPVLSNVALSWAILYKTIYLTGQRDDRHVPGSCSLPLPLQIEVQSGQNRHDDRSSRLTLGRPRQGAEQLHHENQRMVRFYYINILFCTTGKLNNQC